jgi:hypothetical protein
MKSLVPARSRRKPSRVQIFAASALLLVTGFVMVGGGIFELVVQRTGVATLAQITDCHEVLVSRYPSVTCSGTWTTGDLLGDGHVVLGTVDGATERDIGRAMPVRLWGDRAYAESMRLPIILIALGLSFFAAWAQLIRRAMQRAKGAVG